MAGGARLRLSTIPTTWLRGLPGRQQNQGQPRKYDPVDPKEAEKSYCKAGYCDPFDDRNNDDPEITAAPRGCKSLLRKGDRIILPPDSKEFLAQVSSLCPVAQVKVIQLVAFSG